MFDSTFNFLLQMINASEGRSPKKSKFAILFLKLILYVADIIGGRIIALKLVIAIVINDQYNGMYLVSKDV